MVFFLIYASYYYCSFISLLVYAIIQQLIIELLQCARYTFAVACSFSIQVKCISIAHLVIIA